MSKVRVYIQWLARNDFVVAGLVLGLFLLTNRYVYGWDDQHLEITMLKHLIDPALFAGDYYVESLSKNFPSYLFPILSRLISVEMIPAVYLVLFCVVRFFFFYWVYRLWQWLAKDRLTAFCATLSLFLLGRTEELIYRTFSHQEFSYAIIFAGFYFFYRERLLLAALIFGVAANFHALYSLFPMMFLAVYALIFVKDRGMTFLKTGVVFTLAAMPFLVWHIPHAFTRGPSVGADQWVPMYLLSCPQCFPLGTANPDQVVSSIAVLGERLYPYIFLVFLYIGHCIFNIDLRRDKKVHTIFWVSALMVGLCFFFAYVKPNRAILDLNLTRLIQFVHFLLIGYTVLFLMKLARRPEIFWAPLAGVLFLLIGWADTASVATKFQRHWWIFVVLAGAFVALYVMRKSLWADLLKKAFIVIPLVGMFIVYCGLHYNYVQIRAKAGGFWQLQRNWEDMQYFVRDHTPKNAMLLTPYDMEMGGFRIHSNRKVVVCYRDCGIIGFDYAAAEEWQQRIKDVEAFKVFSKEDIRPALMNAIGKYKVDYIVFMRYYEPKQEVPFLKRMYANEVFSLYQVIR